MIFGVIRLSIGFDFDCRVNKCIKRLHPRNCATKVMIDIVVDITKHMKILSSMRI